MNLITKGAIVHSLIDIEIFSIKVDEFNYQIVRKKLEFELQKIIQILRILKEDGEIKSISKPRSKKLQTCLNRIVEAKKVIKQSINNISEMFYK